MNTGSISHIPEDLLERYAMGRLPRPDRARLHKHLPLCSSCQIHLREIDEYVRVMKAALLITSREPTGQQTLSPAVLRKPQPTAWVAGFAALVLLCIPFYRDKIAAVTLTAERGAFSMPHARAGHVLLQIDVTEIPQQNGYQLEVAGPTGQPIWHFAVDASNNRIAAAVPKRLSSGRYWVRLYDTGSPWTLLREYGMDID